MTRSSLPLVNLGLLMVASLAALNACGKTSTDDSGGVGGNKGDGAGNAGGVDSQVVDGEHTCEELWELGYFTDYYNYCDFPEQMGPEPDEQLPITEEQLRESISDGWATSLQLPEDTRPAAPEWTPPFEVGASGWKDSSAPFCQPFEKPPDLSGLWVDERGAFVSVARHCGYALGKEVCDETQGGALYHNTGDGWVVIATPAERIPQMHAFSDGRFLFGTQTLFDLDAGATVIADPSFGLSGAHIVARDLSALLFASDFDLLAGPSLTLYQLVDDAWVEQPEVEGLWHSAAFGADDSIVLAGGDGLAIFDGSSTTPVGNVPAGNYKGGVWADAANDFYVVNQVGQLLHYDGDFRVMHDFEEEIELTFRRGGNRLFFITDQSFGVIENGSAEMLLEVPLGQFRFTQLATDGDGNAYLGLLDQDLKKYRCGEHVMLYYDGNTFHRF